MSEKPVLQAQAVERRFQQGAGALEVLRGADLELEASETLAIIGASGSGKSTLLHVLGGLDLPDAGSVHWAGCDIAGLSESARARLRNETLGFVYQFHHLLAEFTALENAAMPLLIRGEGRSVAEQRAEALLERVGLQARLAHRPAELSGGERQRVAIARALAGAPRVLLADEPTGNLDEDSARRIEDLLLELNAETGVSILLVTHDLALARRMARTLRLDHGRLVTA